MTARRLRVGATPEETLAREVARLSARLEDLRGTALARIAGAGPRIAAGAVLFDDDIADSTFDDRAVTFPTGRFTATPRIVVTPAMMGNSIASVRYGRLGTREESASGCVIRCYADGGTWVGNASRVVRWVAVQV